MNRILLAAFVVLFSLPGMTGCRKAAVKPPIPVPEVIVEPVVIRDVTPYISRTGEARAFEFVEVPARVSGFLRKVRYTPGDFVKVGDPLFLIEPDQYAADVQAAEAQLASAKARLKLDEANLVRTTKLLPSGAKNEEDLQTDTAQRDESEAAVLRAEASLASARLNLSYTDVRSPIAGKTDRNFVDVGNLVSPNAISISGNEENHSVLTTVAGMDPIYIYFDISDYQFNSLREYAKQNKSPAALELIEKLKKLKESRLKPAADDTGVGTDADADVPVETPESSEPAVEPDTDDQKAIPIEIEFEISLIKGATPEKSDYPYRGIIGMASNVIDNTTGTITIRGEIPNEDYAIFPGQICRVRIPLWTVKDAVLVRQEAIGADMNQRYVYVVDAENKAHRRVVELGDPQSDGTRVIVSGLKQGDRYVVSGIQKVRDGAVVKPVEPPAPKGETPQSEKAKAEGAQP